MGCFQSDYNGYGCCSYQFSSLLERLLLGENELRQCIVGSHLENSSTDKTGRISETLKRKRDKRLKEEGNIPDDSCVERDLEESALEGKISEGSQRQDVKQRLLVVANRLPFTVVREDEDQWSLTTSSGGLVSALRGVTEFDASWIGWPGIPVPDETGQKSLTEFLAKRRCIPVFLDEETIKQYYNGYCNNILWPLFHYLGLPQEDSLATSMSFHSQFVAYKKANQMFADAVNKHYQEGDVVWCHDYHLMYLPKYLKESNSKMKVGWFLHTPFPSSEVHRMLPYRSELLHSVLAADLVAFHTYDYARHFVSSCTRILGLEGSPKGIEVQGRMTRVAALPIGIDSDQFIQAFELPRVQGVIKKLEETFQGKKVILGIDRLDISKGIPQKILAFEQFLQENVDWRGKVVLIQIAVPSRTDVLEYQKVKRIVHEFVGRINGKYRTPTILPIHHLDFSIGFHALCALYALTDVALVTSLRDGMNLVSYEYVACQERKKGVLILSEFAGAAQSLGAGAILVNPWNISEVASAIAQALDMPSEEREKRHTRNFLHVKTHSSQKWAESFVSELNNTYDEQQLRARQVRPLPLPTSTTIERYLQSTNRLIILGFYSTLSEPMGQTGHQIEERMHPELKQPLTELCGDPKTTVIVLSGSDKTVLEENFREYDLWLAAENGMFLRPPKGEWMTTMPECQNMEWFDCAKHVFEYFTERTPGSHFKAQETSLVWNYNADVEFGRLQAKDMLQHLWTGPISNAQVDVVQGSRSIEVRAFGITKGAAIDRILTEILPSKSKTSKIDYVLCIGHYLPKDEDVFQFLDPELPQSKRQRRLSNYEKKMESHVYMELKEESYFSCTVGRTQSKARYMVESSSDVVAFLKELVAVASSTLST